MKWLLIVPMGWLLLGLVVALILGRIIRNADEREGTGELSTGLAEGSASSPHTLPRR